ncbi:MAG: hypothetical protein GF411_19130 [Candidatus Lokiarchaeota archaeon]|nr:hypothetical protein [Candidatus Lokiarchaeota archaeon]
MTWIPLLLSDPSPLLRKLVLVNLLERSNDDSEVQELKKISKADPLVVELAKLQREDGSWIKLGYPGEFNREPIRATSYALMKLGYLGFNQDYPIVDKAVSYLFSRQQSDGGWPIVSSSDFGTDITNRFTMLPLQTAFPLLGLAMTGYASDKRCEQAYDWLLDKKLDDGTWPTARHDEVKGYQAGYRRMPNSRWGCRTNTTLALQCLSYHPTLRNSTHAKEGLDKLLARETRERDNIGHFLAKVLGFEQHRGSLTYHAKFDLALILNLCARIGVDRTDTRVNAIITWLEEIQGQYGLWEYKPIPYISKWITYEILWSIKNLSDDGWLSNQMRSPFQSYTRKPKRF